MSSWSSCVCVFFKQKTDYELRISDWSSDVGSSDLHGQVIFFCAASFQADEAAPEHQLSMPEVPRPEDIEPAPAITADVLATLPTKVQRWLDRMGPFEFRHVYPREELKPPKRPPYQQFRSEEQTSELQSLMRLSYAVL